jgi:hypothetical protein
MNLGKRIKHIRGIELNRQIVRIPIFDLFGLFDLFRLIIHLICWVRWCLVLVKFYDDDRKWESEDYSIKLAGAALGSKGKYILAFRDSQGFEMTFQLCRGLPPFSGRFKRIKRTSFLHGTSVGTSLPVNRRTPNNTLGRQVSQSPWRLRILKS